MQIVRGLCCGIILPIMALEAPSCWSVLGIVRSFDSFRKSSFIVVVRHGKKIPVVY